MWTQYLIFRNHNPADIFLSEGFTLVNNGEFKLNPAGGPHTRDNPKFLITLQPLNQTATFDLICS